MGGNSKTSVIGTCHDEQKYSQESLWTLKFIQRVKLIKNKAVVNEETTETVETMRDEIKKLKNDLALVTSALTTNQNTDNHIQNCYSSTNLSLSVNIHKNLQQASSNEKYIKGK